MAWAVRVGAILLAAIVLCLPAHAQNLVQNPGFEDSTTSTTSPFWNLGSGGGTSFDNGGGGSAQAAFSPNLEASGGNPNAYNGLWDVQFGSTSAEQATSSTLSQTIATTPGATYLVTFFLMNSAGPHNSFLATFGGQTVLSLTDANAFSYT